MRLSRPTRAAFGAPLAALLLLVLGHGLLRSQPGVPPVHTFPLSTLPTALAIDASTQRAFVLTSNGTLNILDLARTRLLRTLAVPSVASPTSTLAVDARTHRLFVADPVAGVVYVLDSRNGTLSDTVHVGQGVSALAVDTRQGHVFMASAANGTLSVLDARRGALLRTVRVGDEPLGLAVDAGAARAVVVSVVTARRTAYSAGGRVSLLDTRSGRLLHRVVIGDGSAVLALDTRTGRIFVANRADETVSVLDSRSGAPVRTVSVGAIPTALAVDEPAGRVFVATAGDHTLGTLDARTGRLLHTALLDGGLNPPAADPYALAVDAARGRVYVAQWGRLDPTFRFERKGMLSILDARTGTVLHRITVGVTPQAVAVEESSGRVVVVSGGGKVLRPADDWPAQELGRLRAWLPWLGPLVPRPPAADWVPSSVSVIEAGT